MTNTTKRESFQAILTRFREIMKDNPSAMEAIDRVEQEVLERIDGYADLTLPATLSAIWFTDFASHGKSMFRDCFAAVVAAAKKA